MWFTLLYFLGWEWCLIVFFCRGMVSLLYIFCGLLGFSATDGGGFHWNWGGHLRTTGFGFSFDHWDAHSCLWRSTAQEARKKRDDIGDLLDFQILQKFSMFHSYWRLQDPQVGKLVLWFLPLPLPEPALAIRLWGIFQLCELQPLQHQKSHNFTSHPKQNGHLSMLPHTQLHSKKPNTMREK